MTLGRWIFWGGSVPIQLIAGASVIVDINSAAHDLTLTGFGAIGTTVTWVQVSGVTLPVLDPNVPNATFQWPANFYSPDPIIFRMVADADPLIFVELELKNRFESDLIEVSGVLNAVSDPLNRAPTIVPEIYYPTFWNPNIVVEGIDYQPGTKAFHITPNFTTFPIEFFVNGYEAYNDGILDQPIDLFTSYVLDPGDIIKAATVWQNLVRYFSVDTVREADLTAVAAKMTVSLLPNVGAVLKVTNVETVPAIFYIGTLTVDEESELSELSGLMFTEVTEIVPAVFYAGLITSDEESDLSELSGVLFTPEPEVQPFEFSSSSGTV